LFRVNVLRKSYRTLFTCLSVTTVSNGTAPLRISVRKKNFTIAVKRQKIKIKMTFPARLPPRRPNEKCLARPPRPDRTLGFAVFPFYTTSRPNPYRSVGPKIQKPTGFQTASYPPDGRDLFALRAC